MIAEDERRADEVSGLVKALGPVNIRSDVHPRDDKATVWKGRHVIRTLIAGMIEEVDENVGMLEGATGIIDRRADICSGSIRPSHYEPAVGQSSDVRKDFLVKSVGNGRRRKDVCPRRRPDRKKDIVIGRVVI